MKFKKGDHVKIMKKEYSEGEKRLYFGIAIENDTIAYLDNSYSGPEIKITTSLDDSDMIDIYPNSESVLPAEIDRVLKSINDAIIDKEIEMEKELRKKEYFLKLVSTHFSL